MEALKNVTPKNKTNRLRGENWTQEEKDLFLEIMRKSASIIENKLTDTNTNRRKKMEWVNVQNKLKELTGKSRDIEQLKGFWRRSKVTAKKNVSQYRRAIHATGGGQRPPSPSPEDLKILEYCPKDFVMDRNDFDSDSIPQLPDEPIANVAEDIVVGHNSTSCDIYEDFDIVEINETSTIIADVHNKEINNNDNVNSNKNDTKVLSDLKIDKASFLILQHEKEGLKQADKKEKIEVKKNITGKAALLESNMEIKKRAMEMMEAEHNLKMQYLRADLAHQQLKHKLDVDLYLLEKEKKQLEIEVLKRKNKE